MHSKLVILGTWIAINGLSGMILASNAAATEMDSRYYTIEKVETHEVTATETQADQPSAAPSISADLMSQDSMGLSIAGVDIGTIINIGKEVWDIIEANKPVANVTTNSASAIPKGVTDWESLAGWQAPQAKTFETSFTNGFGFNVITFQYRVTYTAGGSYQGQGRYLTNVTVTPEDVQVSWGYTFNAKVSIPSITNTGTTKAPIAAADILVEWTIDTVVKHTEQSAEYYVRGDGQFSTLQ